ncbi:MAG: SagB/ThcOx family dehydrogenase [Cytophagales bacterium]|nr:SagB/ThcOx family dehydrogenase [Cytophagales bacterium]
MKLEKVKEQYESKDNSMYGKKNIENSIALLYHENSKFTRYTIRMDGEKIAAFNNPYVIERSSQPFKSYPGAETIDLSIYNEINSKVNFFDLITKRRSVRDYDKNYKLSLFELFILLYNSYGVNYKSKITGLDVEGHIGMRNIPSAGALYPLEIYIVTFNAHIPSGLYHFQPDKIILEKIKEGEFMNELINIIQAEPYVNMRNSSVLIITTGVIERLLIKYGERGYRFLMQESGFVGQMISLLAESIDLGSCMVGGYNDDKVNEFLGIDGVFETVNNILVIGAKKNE